MLSVMRVCGRGSKSTLRKDLVRPTRERNRDIHKPRAMNRCLEQKGFLVDMYFILAVSKAGLKGRQFAQYAEESSTDV